MTASSRAHPAQPTRSDHVRVSAKRLASVDLPGRGSNQHELNGVRQLQEVLGTERMEGPVRWLRLTDTDGVVTESSGRYTWYDARENQPKRSAEYRLYYDAGAPLAEVEPDDLLVLVRVDGGHPASLLAILAPGGSSLEHQLCWLFGLDSERLEKFTMPDPQLLAERSQRIESFEILEALGFSGLEPEPPTTDLALVRRRFGDVFPSTREMSVFARDEAPRDAVSDPDGALVDWLAREELLFRALEEYLVSRKLNNGFSGVDDFISFSLSVQNRRKARMGLALENHLREVFDRCGLRYSYQASTENRSRPDFLFPGIAEYRSRHSAIESLFVLAAKSTCKDRWRQILSEAQRIPVKHLCTLEPGISLAQTDEMKTHRVQLVVPASIQGSYSDVQRSWLQTVSRFVELVGGGY